MEDSKVQISLTPEQAAMVQILLEYNVFNMRKGSAVMHFDDRGLRGIKVEYWTYKD